MSTDAEIAARTTLRPIQDIADTVGIPPDAALPWGRHRAKIAHEFLQKARQGGKRGALVLVTGITPTPAGEGKTTTTIGLTDALNLAGAKAAACLREPSLGPCFGMKGGATGGGFSQVAPAADINLHFTGDFHAIGSAHALLSAMIDNHLYWGNDLSLDIRKITWRRAVDMNDRALRTLVLGLGGIVREDGFDITVASELMALLCLSRDLADMSDRLGRVVIGTRRDGAMVTAADLKASGAMGALLRDAMMPNLVQTLAGSPAFVHGGPFANIAHGCSSVAGTTLALSLADIVVTEAGFGADLGGEKFMDIKCPAADLQPTCAVVVATVRALKMHGGVAKSDLAAENIEAVTAGMPNLQRHVANMRRFGIPVIVALNRFGSDTEREIATVRGNIDAPMALCTHFSDGAAGAAALASLVRDAIADGISAFRPLYKPELALAAKIETIATTIYGADRVVFAPSAARTLERLQPAFGALPVCVAKTPYSFSADPTLLGAPTGFAFPVREIRLSAGAGLIVALAGDVMTMPGLPRRPAAERIGLGPSGDIEGLN